MPTLDENRKRFSDAVEKGAVAPVTTPAVPQVPIPVATYPAAPNSFLRTPLPSPSVQQPDQQRQWQTGASPQARISPQSSTGNAVAGAQSVSQTIVQVGGGGGGPLLETNNRKNNSQGVLNLISGSNVTLSADSQGGVTIGSTGGTSDGLVHGDAIWEIDPAFVLLRDDFISVDQTSTLNSFISEFPWFAVLGGSTSSVFNGGFQFPYNGVINLSNDANPNRTSKILPQIEAQPEQFGWPLLDYPKWKLIWVFGISRVGAGTTPGAFNWTQVSHYMGLANYPFLGGTLTASNTPRPPHFLGLRYDTDTTAPSIGDTTFHFEYVTNLTGTPITRINTQGTTFDTGISATEGRFYRFEMTYTASGSVLFFFTDGVTTATTTMTVAKLSTSTAPTVAIANGIGTYSTTDALPWAPGSKATISGGVVGAFNTTVTMMPNTLQPFNGSFLMAGSQGSTSDTGATTSIFPALVPFISFGNDTQAGPITNTKAIQVDYFGFVWNPGVGGNTATPNSTLARYF